MYTNRHECQGGEISIELALEIESRKDGLFTERANSTASGFLKSRAVQRRIRKRSPRFNPRPHAEGDTWQGQGRNSGHVSIHAPARGATIAHDNTVKQSLVSIHAPARGATAQTYCRESAESNEPFPRQVRVFDCQRTASPAHNRCNIL